MGRLLGQVGHSARYTRDLARIQQDVVSRGGVSWANMEPTAIRLSVSIAGMLHTYQETSSRLRRIVDAIHHTQSIEQEALDQGKSRGHLFRIVDVGAHLRDTTLHDELAEAMTNLLQTGVRVSELYLPETREHIPSVRLWGPFVRALTGIDMNAEGRITSVRHIKMPGSYVTQLHFALFCSALVYAKGVESLTIFCESVEKLIFAGSNTGKKNLFGTKSSIRSHSWRWLSFALFSKASTSSVAKLAIRGEGPAAVDLPAIQKMVESENPFYVLRDSVPDLNLFPVMKPDFSRSTITIRPGSFFRVLDGLHDMEECQAPVALTGELLSEAPVTGEHVGSRVAFVPGYGLCWGLLPSLTKPEPTIPIEQRASRFANLAIEPPGRSLVQPKDIFDVVKLVGSRLRGLMVRADADEATFRGILYACPNLESFRFRSGRLASLDALTQAYAKGTKISSIFLSVTDIPEREVHNFLRQLAVAEPTENTAAFTLERLRMEIQEDRSTGVDLMQLIETVLETNTTITHLTGEHVLESPVKLDRFDGQLLPGKSPTQKAQALALASGLGGVAGANPSLELDANARKLVWELASEPRYREVRWRRTYMVRTIMSR